ncbi:MAG: tetratricopeptide repeat protein [Betaproteobacteria bacterium]|nr:tetratricopeptide repeat protein [Betaproteobacteria bacterium]
MLKAAQESLAANNPKQAYMLLVAEQDRFAGDIEFDYLLGVASLDSGKIDEAIIAFERVLAVNPKHAGAQMDLARAYYTAGSLDLAEGTFKKLKESNPPAIALMAIDRYLDAIAEQRKKRRRVLAAWGEMSLGYDSNLTGVPRDFSSAVASSFNLQGISPTGNSIERKAPYLGAALGVDYTVPIGQTWSGFAGGEVRERAYRRQAAFRSTSVDGRAGVAWTSDAHQLRFGVSGNRFDQEGAAPGDPKPTNDRRSGMASADYRYALSDRQQLSFGINAARTRFPANDVEDFNSTIATLGWIRAFDAKNAPLLQISTFYSRDKAVRKLADGLTDKSKGVYGLRGYFQFSLTEKLGAFTSVGYTERKDKDAFARATQVEIGKDKLSDLTLGLNWRFQKSCALRTQWFYSRNHSNIAIYEFSRNEYSSNIRCDF